MSDQEHGSDILKTLIALSSELDLSSVLNLFVRAGIDFTGARYGALSILDSHGNPSWFIQSGHDGGSAIYGADEMPQGLGVLGRIPDEGVLLLDSIQDQPEHLGYPKGHPVMTNFLGVAVRVRDSVYGHLYLADKEGKFTEEDGEIVTALASAAGVAIENSRLYESAEQRAKWLAASQEITTALLTGADEEKALIQIAKQAKEISQADTAALILPSVGDTWMIEIANGIDADVLLGQVMPPEGRTMRVVSEGSGLLVDSLAKDPIVRVEALRRFGPALYAPLKTSGHSVGVLLLLREIGGRTFDDDDLQTAQSFAAQAALALVLAEARHAEDVATVLEERERIARDLHDLAIQQLFATGMQLESVRKGSQQGIDSEELTKIIESALDNVDETVRQIRYIVHSLREPDNDVEFTERLRREASLARTGLGFAPSMIVSVNDVIIDSSNGDYSEEHPLIDTIDADIADDIVAVVREGLANAARHANASSVQVSVRIIDGSVEVVVVDDGLGMSEELERRSGLSNLAARARGYDGTFEITSTPTGGTTLRWAVPLPSRTA